MVQPAFLVGPGFSTSCDSYSEDSSDDDVWNPYRASQYPSMGFTENKSAAFLSTGNPCLDFFFHVVPNTEMKTLESRLDLAWKHDPLTTLKLACNLRGVRGTGKCDKEGFYTVALWLHQYHPKTLAGNIRSIAEFGYFKDLPEILYRLLHGPSVRNEEKLTYSKWRFGKMTQIRNHTAPAKKDLQLAKAAKAIKEAKRLSRAKKSKEAKKVSKARVAVERIDSDPNFRFLYERVADLFAERLKADRILLNTDEFSNISLASKWCPSLDSSFDRSTLLCEAIARRVFPLKTHPEYQEIEDAHYAYRIRDRLRKEYLVPLHRALDLPEVYMSAKQWNSLPYERVPSVAMKLYKQRFLKHDPKRFREFLMKVRTGEAKIAAGALLPHEIIKSLNEEDGEEVAELQWKRMVDDLSKKGKLRNCLAICDVSGSMSGIPMDVSVALGMLVSELSDEPWKGRVVSFSQKPQLHRIEGSTLKEKMGFVQTMEWGMNTDFQKVFDKILKVAIKHKVSREQMIKKLFVFSDMEFDQASSREWETDYMVIRKKYSENGYGDSIPEIVFWNLRDSMATPVPSHEKGVALVSGFSKNLLTLFLEDCGEISPLAVMEATISGTEYQKLVVLD